MNNVVIEKANAKDLNAILQLSDDLSVSDFVYDKDVNLQWARSQNGKKYYMEKISGESNVCFIAKIDGKIVGYATAGIKNVPSYRLVKVAELENLFVNSAVRNKGVGKKLVEEFIKWAKECYADKAAVSVFDGNKNAIDFYRNLGFNSFDQTLEMYIK